MTEKTAGPQQRMLYHRAGLINEAGAVSAICYKKPRPIRLNGRESWTLRDSATTCPKCLAIIAARKIQRP
jgi:hypothetical protein